MKVCSQLLALALVWGGDAFIVQDPKAGPKVVVKLAYDDFETRSAAAGDPKITASPRMLQGGAMTFLSSITATATLTVLNWMHLPCCAATAVSTATQTAVQGSIIEAPLPWIVVLQKLLLGNGVGLFMLLTVLFFANTNIKSELGSKVDGIRDKIHRLIRPGKQALMRDSRFILEEDKSRQLGSLRDAEPHTVDVIGETTKLTRYDIDVDKDSSGTFLDLACKPKCFYVRPGYDELYEYVAARWQAEDHYRVILLGNAGTGKSWFQVYALMQLMKCHKNERKFDVVIRQVESSFYVIDLEKAEVYRWKIDSNDLKVLSKGMKKTLYFFEPGGNGRKSPLGVFIPSLSTLSPYIDRIKEYQKRFCRTVYFWPWSSAELWAVICDANLGITEGSFEERYHKFGGILRHILAEDESAEIELVSQSSRITIDILTSQALDIDRDATKGNIGGFLICYDNRSVEGKDRFAKINLEYTSGYVVEAVKTQFRVIGVKGMMENILDRLAGEKIDVSGKMLEFVATELLSRGGTFKWQRKEVGKNESEWEDFMVTKREIVQGYTLSNRFHQPKMLIVPTQMNVPVIDFVFSWPHPTNTTEPQLRPSVVSFQCTWQPSHKFKVGALYNLRHNHMGIPDEQILEIYMICPKQEEKYALMEKQSFLEGAIPDKLKVSNRATVNSDQLQTMWNNTKIFVLRPEKSWEEQIKAYRENPDLGRNDEQESHDE